MSNLIKVLTLMLLVGCSAPFEHAADLEAIGGDSGAAGDVAVAGAGAEGGEDGVGGSSAAGGGSSSAGKPSMAGSATAGSSPGGMPNAGGQPTAGTTTGGTGGTETAGTTSGGSGGTPPVCMDHTCGFMCGDVEPWAYGIQYQGGDITYTYCQGEHGESCLGEVRKFRCLNPQQCSIRQPAGSNSWEQAWADAGVCPQ